MKKSNKKILTVIICTIIMFNFCGILNKYLKCRKQNK